MMPDLNSKKPVYKVHVIEMKKASSFSTELQKYLNWGYVIEEIKLDYYEDTTLPRYAVKKPLYRTVLIETTYE